ncbi:hypothetical protein [Thalassospira sp.]|uniref:hypothetical protein n=1 Tax=Thalassospira sp. TaxID=1912094 RepID=UPI002733F362|nr:hypothetical protein [Thalassospira sp.]MDP2698346.1 hypothetical protein [Thalassospira sp.]
MIRKLTHNLKAAGSNPAPATNNKKARHSAGFFIVRLPGADGLEDRKQANACLP